MGWLCGVDVFGLIECSHSLPVLYSGLQKLIIIIIANFVGSTDNRVQVMNELKTVPGHNDVINTHELRQIVKGLKNDVAVGIDGIPSEVYNLYLSYC